MPVCIEKKILLSGTVQEYPCGLVHYEKNFVILRYAVDRTYRVGGFIIGPGDITYALYWQKCPYTVYTWHLQRPERRLYYFNIADSISLSPETVVWRDLVVDILIDDSGSVLVLDEEELSPDLEPGLRLHIEKTKRHILDQHPAIVREVTTLLKQYNVDGRT
jgi:hypothetical protein